MNKYINYLKNFFTKSVQGQINIILPNNQELSFIAENHGINCDLIIKDWHALDLIIKKGDIGLGEAYYLGMLDSNNLIAFLSYCSFNLDLAHQSVDGSIYNKIKFYCYNNFVRINTKYGSKKNILAHYDVGNNFYKLWLDPTMTYSSALRKDHNQTLQQAQINKYDRIINMIELGDQKILEIGCGWGGFLERLTNHNINPTGITISKQQYNYVKEKINHKAKVLLQDYRDVDEKYHSIVSIEMFEAVGEKYWPIFFNKIKENLTKKGKALIQTITIRDDLFDKYKKNSDYIRHYIFPGGMLPSKEVFFANINKAKLKLLDVFEFGKDYSWTLKEWLKNFNNNKELMLKMNYSSKFLRAWEFYLSMAIAGFETERTNVMQVIISNE